MKISTIITVTLIAEHNKLFRKRKTLVALTNVINGKPFYLMNNILFPNLLLKNIEKQ